VFTAAGIIFVLLIVGAVFLFLARRILRIALKLALVMALVFVVLIGAGVSWWRGWFDGGTKAHPTPTTTNTRSAPGNRRR
jgi:multisubunit Na+/H+ antiporter MnhC subunit